MEFLKSILILFDPTYVQTNKTTDTTETTGNDLSVEMKTFYSNYLIKLVGPQLVHDQFAQQEDIPRNNGKTIEFRKFAPLPKLRTPLQEGVTPAGQKMDVTAITATVAQYGGFIEISDILDMTAYEKIMTEATEMLSQQAGKTLDSVTRDVITAGTNVLYAGNTATARDELAQGTDILTVRDIRKAVRKLKLQNAPKFGNWYVGIIHPDVEFDLMDDEDWKYPHQYVDTSNIYENELGSIAGVRFVETTEAKIFSEAGASDANVYATMIIGEKAYGTTKVDGGGLQHIMKGFGSSGTADPLNQRATAGWKAIKTAVRLVEQYMVRIESTSSFETTEAN